MHTRPGFIDRRGLTVTASQAQIDAAIAALLAGIDTDDVPEGVGNLYYTNERVDDRVDSLIQDGTGLSWTYDDTLNTLTGNVSLAPFSTSDLAEGVNQYYTDERVDDRVAALLTEGTGIDLSYNDTAGTLTITVDLSELSTSTLPEGSNLYFTDERAQDAVGTILVDSSTIDFTYTDATPSITASVIAVPVVDAASDTTTFVGLFGAATGNLPPLTDAGLTYNASSNLLTVGGNLAVNGGDITTTDLTASLFAGATTSIAIGAASTSTNFGEGNSNIIKYRFGGTKVDGTSTVSEGLRVEVDITGTSTVTALLAQQTIRGTITTPDAGITINDVAGLYVVEPAITKGATDTITRASTLLLVGAPTEGTTNYALRSTAGDFAIAGNVRIGSSITLPTVALDVTGAALISSTLGVTGNATLSGATNTIATAIHTNFSGAPISTLVGGSTTGNLLQPVANAHYVIGLRDNDIGDSFAIISGGGNYNTDSIYDTLVAQFKANGAVTIPGTLAVTSGITSDLTGNVTGTVSSLANHDTADLTEGTNLYFTDERVDDRVAALIQNGTGIAWTYDDVANTLTGNVSITQYTDELAQDAIGGILVDSATIDFTYDDATPSITASVITVPVIDAAGDTTTFPLIVGSATGNLAPLTDAGLTYNANTNALSTTTFIGALTGNATTATALATPRTIGGISFDGSANIVPATITVADTTDTTSFVALFESATGDLGPKTDAGLTYNASTGMLTATGLTGPLTGNASTATILQTARTIGNVSFDGSAAIVPETIAVVDSTDATSFVAIFDSATGNLQPKTDASLTYDASTGKLKASSLELSTQIVSAQSNSDLIISGDTTGSTGANIRLLGASHATLANDFIFRVATSNKFLWDDSAGQFEIKGDLNITGAAEFVASQITTGGNYLSLDDTISVVISAGTTATTGGNLALFGPSHGAANDFRLRRGSNNIVAWDDSADTLTLGKSTSDVIVDDEFYLPNIATTAFAGNLWIDSADGQVHRSTSSERYKMNIERLLLDDARNIIFNAKPVTFNSRFINDSASRQFVGFIAEQIDDVDPRFVEYMNEAPESVAYSSFVVPLTLVAQNHENRLAKLENLAGLI